MGLYLSKRVSRVSQRLGVPELTQAQVALRRKVLGAMGFYVLGLLVVWAATWAVTGSWTVATVIVVAVMVLLQLTSFGVRVATYRRAARDRHS